MRWWLAAAVAVVLAAGAGGGAAWSWWTTRVAQDGAIEAAARFVAAWDAGHEQALRAVTGDDERAVRAHTGVRRRLAPEGLDVSLSDVAVSRADKGRASATYTVSWDLGQLGTWRYRANLRLRRRPDEGWAVAWTPTALHPRLQSGHRLERVDTWPSRAPITDADGEVLAGRQQGTGRRVTAPSLAPLLGTVDEVTAERLEELGDPYDAGDTVGLSGIEAAFERRLAGEPGGEVRVVDDNGAVVETLHAVEPAEPEPLAVTLDAGAQRAADAAMDRVGGKGAVAVVDVSSGGVLAAVDRPADGLPRWRAGAYAPGSTFKVVTALALLTQGLGPDAPLDCPATVTATGRRFVNAGSLQLGEVSLAEAFAESCNTAFVGAAERLPQAALSEAAARMGFGTDYTVLGDPVAAAYPEPADGAERAAQAIGQGRMQAAPVHMASVAAGAVSGTWRQPHLRVDADIATGQPLGADSTGQLTSLMRQVVTDGTGTGAQVEGATVRGKTGTAEFSDGEHAWFIGTAQGVAFAVIVEGGGSGGAVAAPIAAELVERLP
jgi:hypothetical protein